KPDRVRGTVRLCGEDVDVAAPRTLDREPRAGQGDGRHVVRLGEVSEQDRPRVRSQGLLQKPGSLLVGQVPVARGDPLLYVPWVGSLAQEVGVVVHLDQEGVAAPEALDDQAGD